MSTRARGKFHSRKRVAENGFFLGLIDEPARRRPKALAQTG